MDKYELLPRTERHLFVVNAVSGWRIERGSGTSLARGLQSREAAFALLQMSGYELASSPNANEYRFDRDDSEGPGRSTASWRKALKQPY